MLALTLSVLVVQVVVGWLTGSLALLADAGHMLSDSFGLVLALAAIAVAQRPGGARSTYGWHRTEVLAAGANGLILLVMRPAPRDIAHLALTHRALHGFGTVGTIVVAALVITGLINAWLLVGPDNISALRTTFYGRLLLAKLALFAAMLGFAALNRFRLTPRFEHNYSVKIGEATLACVPAAARDRACLCRECATAAPVQIAASRARSSSES